MHGARTFASLALLGAGPLKVTPDRGRHHWQGRHPRRARVSLDIRRPGGRHDEADVTVSLGAGWG